MFKVNSKDIRTTSWRRSGIFMVSFQYISHLVLFLTLNINYWVGYNARDYSQEEPISENTYTILWKS